MEACEFWWVLMESIEGCNFIVDQHMRAIGAASSTATPSNSPVEGYSHSYLLVSREGSGEASFLGELIPGLISRLPLTEAQVRCGAIFAHMTRPSSLQCRL
jgi:ribulose kinase